MFNEEKENMPFLIPQIKESIFKVPRIQHSLTESIHKYRVTCIRSLVKFGKTYQVVGWLQEYQKNHNIPIKWLDGNCCGEEQITSFVDQVMQMSEGIVVLDHLEILSLSSYYERIVSCILGLKAEVRCVLITNSQIPLEFISLIAEQQMNIIPDLQFTLTQEEMKEYIQFVDGSGFRFPEAMYPEELPSVPSMINLFLQYTKIEETVSRRSVYIAKERVYEYIKRETMGTLTEEDWENIGILSHFAYIDRPLYTALFEDSQRYEQLAALSKQSCLLIRSGDEGFFFLPYIKPFMQSMVKQYISKERLELFISRGAAYLEEQKQYEEAVKLYCEWKYYDKAMHVICRWMVVGGTLEPVPAMEELLKKIPDVFKQNSLQFCSWKCIEALVNLELGKSYHWYNHVRLHYEKAIDVNEKRKAASYYAFLDLLCPSGTLDAIEAWITYFCKQDYSIEETVEEFLLLRKMPLYCYALFRRWNQENLSLHFSTSAAFSKIYGKKLTTIMQFDLGTLLLGQGSGREGISCISKGIVKAKQYGMDYMQYCGEMILDYYELLQKRHAAKDSEEVAQIYRVLKRYKESEPFYNMTALYFALLNNNREELNTASIRAELLAKEGHKVINLIEKLNLVRVAILFEEYVTAERWLNLLLEYFMQYNWKYQQCAVITLFSVFYYRKGEELIATTYMQSALRLAEPLNALAGIAAEGAAVLPILNSLKSENPKFAKDPFFERVLLCAEENARVYPNYLSVREKQCTPLTKSEIRVLQLLETPLTLGQISEQLCISLNTVKHHTKNIYSKFAVNRRTMAVLVGKELGYL